MQTRGQDKNYHEILTGWKEIARYLGRGVRTVQRYEHQLGLPARRTNGNGGGSVLATKSDLDSWARSRPTMRSFDAQQAGQVPLVSALENSPRERSRLHREMMTLRRELKENIGEIRKDILKLRQELEQMRERQDAIAEAVAWYPRIASSPIGVAKRRRLN